MDFRAQMMWSTAGITVIGLSALIGCGRGGGAVAEVAQEAIAEAVAEQSVSAYYEYTLNLETSNGSLTAVCSHGGDMDWSEVESGGAGFTISSRNCVIETDYGTVTINGEYTATGFPTEDSNGDGTFDVYDLKDNTISIDGSVTATGEEGNSRTCDYSLTFDDVNVTGEEGSVNVSGSLAGQLCGSQGFDLGVDFTVTVE